VGGTVPKEYIPGVQKGVNKAMAEGVLAGYLVVDVKATLVDGSFHPVDSSGIAFEIAGGNAFSKGLKEASPILLEPVMMVAVSVPDTNTGDVIGDLNGKRARILGMTPDGSGLTLIEAHVPQAEVLRYATDLRSLTQGKGLFTMKFDRYEQVSSDLVQRIIATKDQGSES
jgi:elongation factor G